MTLKAQSGCQIPGKHAMIKKQKVFIYFHLNISTFSAACAMWKGNSDWNMNFTPQISGLKDACRWPQASVKRSVFSLRLSSVARIGDVGVLASQVPAWWPTWGAGPTAPHVTWWEPQHSALPFWLPFRGSALPLKWFVHYLSMGYCYWDGNKAALTLFFH